ncbi:MAG: hypothetical protein JWN61_750, partial [Pseudonocardiales bacterium]|nr:hypothetical protein [Pseudonocardiales bacterium]
MCSYVIGVGLPRYGVRMTSMDSLTVRVMRTEEFDAMRALAVGAFGDDGIGDLLDALRESWAWSDELSFVAEHDGDLVGQVLYTGAFVDAPLRVSTVLVLSPIGVRADLQGRGIGSTLMRQSLRMLADRPEPAVFLEGHPRYYPRFGFEPASSLGFTAPSTRIPDEAFMAYRLPRFDPGLSGAL